MLNDTPPPTATPNPTGRIYLPMAVVLGALSIAAYQMASTMPPVNGQPAPVDERYAGNILPNWHPQPFAPVANASRSPCPLLNTLSNHGYLPHDGRNIDRNILANAMGQLSFSPRVRDGLANAIKRAGHVKPELDKGDGSRPNDANAYIMELADLSVHGVIEHDVSLSRQDFRPSLGADRHWKVDPQLVNQIKAHADKNGYLNYDALGKVRNLRHQQVKAEAADLQKKQGSEADRRPVDFGPKAQLLAHGESSLLIEVLGRNGRVHTSIIEAFFINEQIPEGWAPPKKEVGLPTLVGSMLRNFLEYF